MWDEEEEEEEEEDEEEDTDNDEDDRTGGHKHHRTHQSVAFQFLQIQRHERVHSTTSSKISDNDPPFSWRRSSARPLMATWPSCR